MAQELPQIEKTFASLLESLPEIVKPPILHTSSAGGKRLRPLLVVLCAQLLGKPNKEVYALASCLEMIHLASLLHDDVIDNALTRRKKPTAHTIYGTNSTILAGDALLGFACEYIANYKSPELFIAYARASMRTTVGELEEISLQGSLEHGIEKYNEIIRGKTAYLLRSSCMMGALYMQKVMNLSIKDEEVEVLGQYGEEIGMAFQLIDDALDFAPEEQIGKPQGGDIREGKATVPVLAYYHALPESEAIIFKERFAAAGTEREFTQKEVEQISNEILNKGYDALAKDKAMEHIEKAKSCLDIFPDSHIKKILLAATDYICQRKA